MIKTMKRCLLLAAVLVSVLAQAGAVDLIVFGDSLSDSGSRNGQLHTNKPSNSNTDYNGTWCTQLAAEYGLTHGPAFNLDDGVLTPIPGGTNYAFGGARAETGNYSVEWQVDEYLDRDSNGDTSAIYIFQGGGNDFSHGPTPTEAGTNAANSIKNQIARVAAAGSNSGKTIVWFRMFAVDQAPAYASNPIDRALAAQAVAAYNSTLATAVTSLRSTYPNTDFIVADIHSMHLDLMENPGDYGITNVTTPCEGLNVNADLYLYWDEIHPTTKGHSVLMATVVDALGLVGVPQPPTGVTAVSGNAQATISWNASSGATSYTVKRSTTSGSGYTNVSTNQAGLNFTNTGLTNGTTYYYVVTANNANGSSGNSTQVSATPNTAPQAPTGVTAVAGNGQAMISWNASSGATSYTVKRSTTSGSGYTNVSTNQAGLTFTNTGLTNGTTYYYVVTATGASGTSGNSSQVQATPQAPTGGWTGSDIGSPGAVGSYSESGGTFTINGAGSDIFGTADRFQFVRSTAPLNGDGSITARVNSLTNTHAWAKVGVMIRETTDAGSKHVMTAITPGNGVTFVRRSITDGSSASLTTAGVTAPEWVRLVRSGNVFTSFSSNDGTTWTEVGSAQTITMGASVEIGLAVTSHANTNLCTASIDNVSIVRDGEPPVVSVSATDDTAGEGGNTGTFTFTRTTNTGNLTVYYTVGGTAALTSDYTVSPASGSVVIPNGQTSVAVTVTPVDDTTAESDETVQFNISTSSGNYTIGTGSATVTIEDNDSVVWTSQDIGSPTPAGNTSYASGVFTIQGGGSDIFGTSDKFHYNSTPWTGNGSIIANVTSQTNTHAWAKAGVMFRGSTAANSAHAMVIVSPGNGVSFQWRSADGGSSSATTVTGVTAPQWVKLTRSGNSFSAFYSSNGTTWTPIGTAQTITAIPSSARAGLAVTSHNSSNLSTATFSNVSVAP